MARVTIREKTRILEIIEEIEEVSPTLLIDGQEKLNKIKDLLNEIVIGTRGLEGWSIDDIKKVINKTIQDNQPSSRSNALVRSSNKPNTIEVAKSVLDEAKGVVSFGAETGRNALGTPGEVLGVIVTTPIAAVGGIMNGSVQTGIRALETGADMTISIFDSLTGTTKKRLELETEVLKSKDEKDIKKLELESNERIKMAELRIRELELQARIQQFPRGNN